MIAAQSLDSTFAKRLVALLGVERASSQFLATKGKSVGSWIYSRPRIVSLAQILKHLSGVVTIAFSPIVHRAGVPHAVFIAIDNDENASNRHYAVGPYATGIG